MRRGTAYLQNCTRVTAYPRISALSRTGRLQLGLNAYHRTASVLF